MVPYLLVAADIGFARSVLARRFPAEVIVWHPKSQLDRDDRPARRQFVGHSQHVVHGSFSRTHTVARWLQATPSRLWVRPRWRDRPRWPTGGSGVCVGLFCYVIFGALHRQVWRRWCYPRRCPIASTCSSRAILRLVDAAAVAISSATSGWLFDIHR